MHMQCEGAKHVLALDNKSFFQLRATYDIEYTVGTRTRDLTQGKVATKPTTVDNPPPPLPGATFDTSTPLGLTLLVDFLNAPA
jgi:hypothetical protein